MTENLVSIVLPTYNRAHLLGHAIRSVLAQTHRNLELIVVDDNSSDGTPDVVRAFDDPRIRYVRNDANLKLPRGLNKGFALSSGNFLTWTSDDNLYAVNAIERMVAVLRGGSCDFVFADYYHFSDLDASSGEPLDATHIRLPEVLRLEASNAVGACFLYTRALYHEIGDYDPELFLVEDYDYFIRIQKRFRICHIPEPLYYFRRFDESLFCSRFAEVQAAGVLVRFKNGLLDKAQATASCTDLIVKDIGGLRSPMLRAAFPVVRSASFRLTNAYKHLVRMYVMWKISAKVDAALEGFKSKALSFREAKEALQGIMQQVGTVEYKKPPPRRVAVAR